MTIRLARQQFRRDVGCLDLTQPTVAALVAQCAASLEAMQMNLKRRAGLEGAATIFRVSAAYFMAFDAAVAEARSVRAGQ